MTRKRAAWWAVGLGACLGLPGAASAGPVIDLMQPCDCPPTHYSFLHVLTPAIYRWEAWCQGPAYWTFAKNYHPDIVLHNQPVRYHCPSVNPLAFSVDHYPGLANNTPCSCYPSTTQNGGAQGGRAPSGERKLPEEEQLPPPRPDR